MLERFRPDKTNEIPFIIFASFLITFIIIRLFVHLFPEIFIQVRGVHIHHFAYGIVILTLVGLYDLIERPVGLALRRVSILFGTGVAFAYDEFGMWLRLEDYNAPRYGYDAIIVITTVLLNIVYFNRFWKRIGKGIFSKIKVW